MTDEKEEQFRSRHSLQALRELRRLGEEERLRLSPSSHLTVSDLASYRSGTLPAEDSDALQEHLALCPECTRLLLDLIALEPDLPADSELTASDVDAAWLALRPHLPSAAARATAAPSVPAPSISSPDPGARMLSPAAPAAGASPRRRVVRESVLASLCAASLLLALTSALSSRHQVSIFERRSRAAELAEKLRFRSTAAGTRSLAPRERPRNVFANGDAVTLELPLPREHVGRFRLSIEDSSHRELHPDFRDAAGKLRPFPLEVFSSPEAAEIHLTLRRGWLPAGDYTLIVTTLATDGTPQPIPAAYPIHLR